MLTTFKLHSKITSDKPTVTKPSVDVFQRSTMLRLSFIPLTKILVLRMGFISHDFKERLITTLATDIIRRTFTNGFQEAVLTIRHSMDGLQCDFMDPTVSEIVFVPKVIRLF